jgi:glycosyltransferase involved in cell wall biosynthesis
MDPGIHYLQSPIRAFGINRHGARWATPLAVKQARKAAWSLGIERPLLWISAPSGRALRGQFGERVAVYDCPDDLELGGAHRVEVEEEPRLIRDVDLVFTVSSALKEAKSGLGTPVSCVLNGVEAEHFQTALHPGPVPERLARLPSPIVGYVGVIYDRIDWDMVRHVATSRPAWTFVFIGLVSCPPPGGVAALPNVQFLGAVSNADLPAYYRGIDVCWIPHRVNELTVRQNSMKAYEYLASGRRAVATEIPIADDVRSALHVVKTSGQALTALEGALAAGIENGLEDRLRVARNNSWPSRFEAMQAEILKVMA